MTSGVKGSGPQSNRHEIDEGERVRAHCAPALTMTAAINRLIESVESHLVEVEEGSVEPGASKELARLSLAQLWNAQVETQAALAASQATITSLALRCIESCGDIPLGGGERLTSQPDRSWSPINQSDVIKAITTATRGRVSRWGAVLSGSAWNCDGVAGLLGEKRFRTLFRRGRGRELVVMHQSSKHPDDANPTLDRP